MKSILRHILIVMISIIVSLPLLANQTKDLKVLLIRGIYADNSSAALTRTLGSMGSLYEIHSAGNVIAPGFLSNGSHANFSAIIITSQAAYDSLTKTELTSLENFRNQFGIRVVSFATKTGTAFKPFGSGETVFNIDASTHSRFPYAKLNGQLPMIRVDSYFTAEAAGAPILTDLQGRAFAIIDHDKNHLKFSFDIFENHGPSMVIAHGALSWAMKSVYLGAILFSVSAHIDDVFIGSRMKANYDYRLDAKDIAAVINWQNRMRANPVTNNFRFDFAYNGAGAAKDPLTTKLVQNQKEFKWINHTLNHENLDGVSEAVASTQITKNIKKADQLGLEDFSVVNLVTPEISGLTNSKALQAAYKAGVRYVVGDNSDPDKGKNLAINTGIHLPSFPQIFMIQRHATDLGYNVSTPEEWYGNMARYRDMLEKHSQTLLKHVVAGDLAPWMFHQANLRAYDDNKSATMLTDLLESIFEKYSQIFSVPLLDLSMDQTAEIIYGRTYQKGAGLKAILNANGTVTFSTVHAIVFQVSGIKTADSFSYAGSSVSTIRLKAGESKTISIQGK